MKTTIIILTILFLAPLYINNAIAQDKRIANEKRLKSEAKRKYHSISMNGPKANKTTAANGNWSNAATWGGTLPADGDNITINHNVTLDMPASPVTTGLLTINSGKTLTVSSETSLYIGSTASISGTLLVNAGSAIENTWILPLANFTVAAGGVFNATAANTVIDFIGSGGQSFTFTGTVTSPVNDLSIDNPSSNITLVTTGTINVTNLNLYNGNLVNTATKNVSIVSGGLIDRFDGTIAVTPLGSGYVLQYDNSGAINTGPELQNNTVISDLIINGSDNVTLNSDATVNGNFIILGGNLNIDTRTLTLNGNIQVDGGFFSATLTGGTNSKLTLGGTGDVTLPDIQTQQLNTLTINRTANNKITLGGDLQIRNILDIESGNINTGTYNLTLGYNGSNLGTLTYNAASNTGIITGKFTRWFGTSTTQPIVKFPVGEVSAYSTPRMVTIQYGTTTGNRPTTAGTLTAQFITGDPITLNTASLSDGGYTVNTYSSVGYWQLTPTTIAGGTYSMTISPTGFNGMRIYYKLRILERPSSGTLWTLQGTHVNGDSIPVPVAKRSGLSGFGQFGLGGNTPDNPLDALLPVELSSFSYSVSANDIKLSWITASEVNNSGFEIYRKSEQTDWSKIGFVKGSGTVNTPKTYYFTDKNLNTGKYSYKLKQIDYNGNYEYFTMSGIAEIGTPNKFEVSQNYPNPFNPSTTIGYSIPKNDFVTLKVYDMSGKEVAVLVNSQLSAGYYTVNFNADIFHLSSGMYFYKLSTSGNSLVKKLLLLK